MVKGWGYPGAALLLACSVPAISSSPAPAATAAASKTATFKVGGLPFEMPIPEGYCPPVAGVQTRAVQLMSEADNQNTTLLALFPCTSRGSAAAGAMDQGFIIIKAPTTMLDTDVAREAMLEELGAAFDNPSVKEDLAAREAEASRRVGAKAGETIEMVGVVGPRGRDDVCAYLGGSPEMKGDAGTIRLSMGACLTVVGSRLITLVVCAPDSSGSRVAALMARARQLVETIRRTS